MYKELLEYIVKNLVTYPDKVEISQNITDDKVSLKLTVAKEDMGRVIGKEGRIIRSIREIIYAYASKESKKATIDVEEAKEND